MFTPLVLQMIAVGEETGAIAICKEGKIDRNLSEDEFRKRLAEIFLSDEQTAEEMVREELAGEDSVAPAGDRSLVSD